MVAVVSAGPYRGPIRRTGFVLLALFLLVTAAAAQTGPEPSPGPPFRLAGIFELVYSAPRGPAFEGLGSGTGRGAGARLWIYRGIFAGWQYREQDLEPTLTLVEWLGYDWDWRIETTETFYSLGYGLTLGSSNRTFLYLEAGLGRIKQLRRQSTFLTHEGIEVTLVQNEDHRAAMVALGLMVPAGRYLAFDMGLNLRKTEADANYHNEQGDGFLWGLRAGFAGVLGGPAD